MKKSLYVMFILVVLFVVIGAGIYFKRLGFRQHEIALSNRLDAQENVVESSLFKMRSTIKNIHNCTDEWADKFILSVQEQAKGRPGGVLGGEAGVLGKLVGGGVGVTRESESLGIPSDMYMKLANAIEGQMANFTRQQDTLTDIWRSHKTYCEDPAINEFWRVDLLSKVKERPVMITSGDVKEAMKTKTMDEELF